MSEKKRKKMPSPVSPEQPAKLKKQAKALQQLQKKSQKIDFLCSQLADLIATIPNTVSLEDKDGRKWVTEQLTHRLFRKLDMGQCGELHQSPLIKKPVGKHSHGHFSLERDFHLALARHQFRTYYQIITDGNYQPVGAEVLLRWDHPRYGLISPEHFIPIAERTHLILPLGEWVLQETCEQLRKWQNAPSTVSLPLSVNVSSFQFSHSDFVHTLRRIVEEKEIKPGLLNLELTENLMLNDLSHCVDKMTRLKHLGIQFSMNNFGTGMASLKQLKKLPIDQLKIDRNLTQTVLFDHCDAAIVKVLTDMAKKLKLNTVAVGVEDEQQFDRLKQLGCSAFQGYLLGRPMLMEELEKLLTDVTQRKLYRHRITFVS